MAQRQKKEIGAHTPHPRATAFIHHLPILHDVQQWQVHSMAATCKSFFVVNLSGLKNKVSSNSRNLCPSSVEDFSRKRSSPSVLEHTSPPRVLPRFLSSCGET